MKIKSGIIGLITLAILASCSTSNDVVSGRNIQKRKYNDGYYISGNNKFKNNTKADNTEAVILTENISATEINEVTQPKTSEVKTPSLNPDLSENIIPAGTSEGPVSESALTDGDVTTTDKSVARPLNVTKSEQKVTFKPGRTSPKMIQQVVSDNSGSAAADAMLILLVILCFFIPPLAVFIFEGATGRFWIDLILFIIGIAVVGWFLNGLAGLALLVSIIYALLIVLSVI